MVEITKLFKKYFVGGVNSPVRAFKNIMNYPLIIKKANGAKIYDMDNREYIDFCMSWGAEILGHRHKLVEKAIKDNIKNGICYGFNNLKELELANLIIKGFPNIEKIRFVNSGTEATMSAIRLARAFTKRKKIIKFDGCYHGHSDFLLISAGSGVTRLMKSNSLGIRDEIMSNTISLPFNDFKILKKIIEKEYKYISCVIIEPIPANMGVVLPEDDFLYKIRNITEKYDILLIFDEIITGFRFCYGGVQKIYNIVPDLTCLGKIIGGGLPIGAFGGKKQIMDLLAPNGNVYQAGTFSGNPIVMSAGIAVLKNLQNTKLYNILNKKIELIANEMKKIKDIYFSYFGSMFTLFFYENKVRNFADAKKSNLQKFKKFYLKMLDEKFLLPPSQFETCFVSLAHSDNEIEKFIKIILKNIYKVL